MSGMNYLHDHDVVPRDLKYVAPSFTIHPPIFGELFRSNAWLVNRPENTLFHKDIVIADFGMCIAWSFSLEICCICMSFDLAVPSISIPLGNHSRLSQEVWEMSLTPEVPNKKGHGKPIGL